MDTNLINFAEIREVTVDSTNVTHGVDMANFDGVLFIVKTSGTETIKAQQDDELDASDELLDDPSDLVDASITSGADDINWIDIYRPDERYVALDVEDNTAVEGAVLALKYHGRVRPENNDTDDVEGVKLISPDEA